MAKLTLFSRRLMPPTWVYLKTVILCTSLLTTLIAWTGPSVCLAEGDRYGAIAYCKTNDVPGMAHGFHARADAEEWAIHACALRGGRNCEVVTWFTRCGALATSSDRAWGAAWDDSKESAIRKAIAACQKHGFNCGWRCWACNSGDNAANNPLDCGNSSDESMSIIEQSLLSYHKGEINSPFVSVFHRMLAIKFGPGDSDSRPGGSSEASPFSGSSDCEELEAWARDLVANKRVVNGSALGNPQRTQIYPANLHLCYDCTNEDGTPGVVILGGHGGWSHFWPAVVRVQRNCNCGTANLDINY